MKITFKRSDENPILVPKKENEWESEAVFNGCPVADKQTIHFLYRAVSKPRNINDAVLPVSSIGYTTSADGIHFRNRRQFITPEYEWEQYGCEDPRVTKFGGAYYIFYTALGAYPFRPEKIRIAVAKTKNFKRVEEKHLVTPFNAKACALFPEKINGKMAALLTVHTDTPPAYIALALFDKEEDMWSAEYWKRWHESFHHSILFLKRAPEDHLELGAPPIKTKYGWLIIYSSIQNYFKPPMAFGIEAALLDLKNPTKIIARTTEPILVPEEEYEIYGMVPNVVFPSGVLVRGSLIYLYYGASDTTCAVATYRLETLLKEMMQTKWESVRLERYRGNPIIAPIKNNPWEAKAAFNPAAIYEGGKVHVVYRAMSEDNTSTLGYASSKDGFTITERLEKPIYVPRESFEEKKIPGGNSGCEDPRLTVLGPRIYLCYTAYNGIENPRVALTSIAKKDFLAKQWIWKKPVLISPPGMDDKDAAIFPKKIKGKYAILHRLGVSIWLAYVEKLTFDGKTWIGGKAIMNPRPGPRDSRKIGIAGPPIETSKGWLLLYHGISKRDDRHYHVRAALLDLKEPSKVIARTKDPILDSEMPYEKQGQVSNVVFPCGAVVIGNKLFVYYGAGDTVIGVATVRLSDVLDKLIAESKQNK